MSDARKHTNRLLEMIDEGVLDPANVVTMCVKWMSEDDVEGMMDANELSSRFEDEYDEEQDDD
jgi:hypothetical protein